MNSCSLILKIYSDCGPKSTEKNKNSTTSNDSWKDIKYPSSFSLHPNPIIEAVDNK